MTSSVDTLTSAALNSLSSRPATTDLAGDEELEQAPAPAPAEPESLELFPEL